MSLKPTGKHAELGVMTGDSEDGVEVVGLQPGGAAARAGLRVGDQIRYVDDDRVQTTQELAKTIQSHQPGSQVDLLIRRNGDRRVVKATLASQEASANGRRDGNRNDDEQRRNDRDSSRMGSNDQRMQRLEQQLAQLRRDVNRLMAHLDLEREEKDHVDSEDWGWNGRDGRGSDPAINQ